MIHIETSVPIVLKMKKLNSHRRMFFPVLVLEFYDNESLNTHSCHNDNLYQTSAETFGMLLLREELYKCACFCNIPLWYDRKEDF